MTTPHFHEANGSTSSCGNRYFLLFLLEGSEGDLGCQARAYGEIRNINCHVFVFPLLQS